MTNGQSRDAAMMGRAVGEFDRARGRMARDFRTMQHQRGKRYQKYDGRLRKT